MKTFLMNEKKANIFVLVIGILVYPLGLWGTIIPGNVLYQMGLDDIMLLSILFAWIIAIVTFFISLTRVSVIRNIKSKIFWIGITLNVIYIVTPAIILIRAFLRLILFGEGV